MLDKAIIAALRCEYYRKYGKKPTREFAFWRFAAEYFALAFHECDDDCYYDFIHTVFDRDANLIAHLYPAEFEAIKADEDLADIYLSSDEED